MIKFDWKIAKNAMCLRSPTIPVQSESNAIVCLNEGTLRPRQYVPKKEDSNNPFD